MLKLGTMRIHAEELRWMRWSRSELVLGLRWRWDEVPALMELSGNLLLRWEHVRDPSAGVPVRLREGDATALYAGLDPANCRVQITLEMGPSPLDVPGPFDG